MTQGAGERASERAGIEHGSKRQPEIIHVSNGARRTAEGGTENDGTCQDLYGTMQTN